MTAQDEMQALYEISVRQGFPGEIEDDSVVIESCSGERALTINKGNGRYFFDLKTETVAGRGRPIPRDFRDRNWKSGGLVNVKGVFHFQTSRKTLGGAMALLEFLLEHHLDPC